MKSILLTEDDPFILDIYSTKLRQEGFKVDIARDGLMALEKVQNNYPDLLILDISLPKMDGWALLKKLRSDAKTKNIKVIMLSNLSQQDYLDDISNLGVLHYFVKVETHPEEIANAAKEILK